MLNFILPVYRNMQFSGPIYFRMDPWLFVRNIHWNISYAVNVKVRGTTSDIYAL